MKMKAYQSVITAPLAGRATTKPRTTGYTMVLDKGLGLNATTDLLAVGGDYVDAIKLTFGTSALYDANLLRDKIVLIREAQIDVYPGGTLLEVAVLQGVYESYLRWAREMGFTALEVSDGTIVLSIEQRRAIVAEALDAGFKVISEVGKKDPKDVQPMALMHEEIANDLAQGVFKVIVEARESGKGVGIFNAEGGVQEDEIQRILEGGFDPNSLIWEAPIKNQQFFLIKRFGPNVNLGNVPTDEVVALECLRLGLRGDTLKLATQQK